jgi:manganese/zinc/iron transport system permease protein
MEIWLEFLSFSDPGTRIVTLGSVLLGAIASLVGCFTFLQKRALIGDTISHAVLPGICLAFILSGAKNPYTLLLGAFLSGWLAVLAADFITRSSKIKADTSIAIVLSFFFAVGMMLLSMIQHSGNANQAGLHHFLFGKAAAIVREDVQMFLIVGLVSVVIILLFYRQFKLYIFDRAFAQSIGLPVKFLDFLLTTLAVLAIAIGIRAVGVVLMAALLITPAAVARFWTGQLKFMLVLAAAVGGLAGFTGAMISYTAPSMPTGPWIIVVLSLMAFISIFTGTEKGVLHRLLKQRRFRLKVIRENVLKTFYHLGEADGDIFGERAVEALLARRPMTRSEMKLGLRQLQKMQLIVTAGAGNWQLTGKGSKASGNLVRLHRLWEVYLSEYLDIAPDHVHDDADAIEHVLTPELQQRLEKILAGRTTDPHDRDIPGTVPNAGSEKR